MTNKKEDLTYEERMLMESAEEAERLMDDDMSGWERVDVRVAKNVKHVFSFRIDPEDLDEIFDAAEAAGQNMSEFVRNAAINAARRKKGESAIDEVRKKARELSEAVNRL